MPAGGPVSLPEVWWEVRRCHTEADLLTLLTSIRYWATHETKSCAKTATPAAVRKLIKTFATKRAALPDAWTPAVAAAMQACLLSIKSTVAAKEKSDAPATSTEGKGKGDAKKPTEKLTPNADVDVTAIDFKGCDAMFLESFKKFYHTDPKTILAGVNKALTDLKTSKEYRPRTIKGTGADHILHVVQLNAGPEVLLQSVRLLAEAALHDLTEATFFRKGAVEAAMRIGRESQDLEIRCHAARLFFNLAYLKANRPAFIKKGGLHHVSYLAKTTEGDTSSGNAQKLILFAAKTMYQLSCQELCAAKVFHYSGFKPLWLSFAQHPTQDVRQRAAGVFNKVVDLNLVTASVHADWCRFMVEEVLYGTMANDTNNNASQAQKKARAMASSQGWRYLSSRAHDA